MSKIALGEPSVESQCSPNKREADFMHSMNFRVQTTQMAQKNVFENSYVDLARMYVLCQSLGGTQSQDLVITATKEAMDSFFVKQPEPVLVSEHSRLDYRSVWPVGNCVLPLWCALSVIYKGTLPGDQTRITAKEDGQVMLFETLKREEK
ncbi:hypothetical protein DM02DRAFT_634322 [Periconia macrospinosa]|uniref:Uncharacterized protein n=1 Tax=Periconia macrospinosa TaxID=97972 RepID=A0A2V1D915_9PLEO|nr:hypothetical protein DM02DRAFT_634322 [Periconia macrospinosa]